MRLFRTFLTLSPSMRKAVLSAFFLSGKYRFLLLHRPFAEFSSVLGAPGEKEYRYTEEELRTAAATGRAVSMVCRHTPWQSLCLVQAFAACTILHRRRIPCNVYLGVRSKEDRTLSAHAWVRCGSLFVTGGPGHENYTVTGIFHG